MDGKSDNQLQNDPILPVSDVDRSATTVEQHIEEEKSAANGGNLNTKRSDDEGGECSATNIRNAEDETPKSTDTETMEKSAESTPIASSDTRRAPNLSATGKTSNKRTSATDLSNLSRLLGTGGKKSKMSTLEKSQLDWNSYKAEQQIGEELETHNRGRDGYLERQDFLIRADHRQFEAERSARNAIRKK